MLNIDGFRLIRISDTDVEILTVSFGRVEYEPAIRWRFEKPAVFNPTIIIRRGKYCEDQIVCIAVAYPDDAKELMAFVDTTDSLSVEFDWGSEVKQLAISAVDKLPKIDDDAREFRSEFTFTSIYDDTYSEIDLTGYSITYETIGE